MIKTVSKDTQKDRPVRPHDKQADPWSQPTPAQQKALAELAREHDQMIQDQRELQYPW